MDFTERSGFARSVVRLFRYIGIARQERVIKIVPFRPQVTHEVYDLTIEKDGCYYAEGILVSNCDALAGAIEALATSDIIAEYAAAIKILKR